MSWERNAKPAAGYGPGMRLDGNRVVLRARLNLTAGPAALLDLAGSPALLDLAHPLPGPELLFEGLRPAE